MYDQQDSIEKLDRLEQLRKTPNNQPNPNYNPEWDNIGANAPAFTGEDPLQGQLDQATPEEWAAIAENMPAFAGEQSFAQQNPNTQSPEDPIPMMEATNSIEADKHANQVPVYQEIYTAPQFGIDASGDDFNRITNEFLAKGFWLKVVGYKDATETNPADISAESQRLHQNLTASMNEVGGVSKMDTLAHSGLTEDQAANIYDLTKKTELEGHEIMEMCKGNASIESAMNDLLETNSETASALEQLMETMKKVDNIGSEMESIDDYSMDAQLANINSQLIGASKDRYKSSLDAIKAIRQEVMNLSLPVELAGAIISKIKDIEDNLNSALQKIETAENFDMNPSQVAEQVAANNEAIVDSMDELNSEML